MVKIYEDLEQGTPEWLSVRIGKMTASKATAIGNYGKGLDTLVENLMAEYFSSGEKQHFDSEDTERGNEYEPVARRMYEFEMGYTVKEVGFIEYNDYVGCSPDGLVGDEGGIEIKCLNDEKYFKHLLYGDEMIDSSHMWQVQMNLLITGRKWWDLIIYNPNYKKSMCIYRIMPNENKFAELLKGFEIGSKRIEEIKNKVNSIKC